MTFPTNRPENEITNTTVSVYSQVVSGTRWFERCNQQYFVCEYDVPAIINDVRWDSDETYGDNIPHPQSLAWIEEQHPGCCFVYMDHDWLDRSKFM